jgi:hypothetical protein
MAEEVLYFDYNYRGLNKYTQFVKLVGNSKLEPEKCQE